MRSTRLPAKVMADLAGQPLLCRVVERARRAHGVDTIIVATTQNDVDDAIARMCEAAGIEYSRGSEDDVLDRYYQAARAVGAGIVVRLTADCPLLDPRVIDRVIEVFKQGTWDYASNTIEPTYPDGLDTEVFSMAALERAWREARLKSEREHVTPYIWKHPSLFRLANVRNERDLSALRWTVDEPEDLEFARRVYMHLGAMPAFGMEDVLRLIEEQPQLQTVNAGFERNEGYQKSVRKDANVRPGEQTLSGTGQALYVTAKSRIPGGTQLLSKRPEMFLPDHWPAYYSKARGVDVWDLDGRRYVDMSCNGIGACVLGAGDPDVDSAVRAAIDAGVMSTLNCPEEVDLAQLLCEIHPWADMVRYARGGGEAMVVAVRIARARMRRDRVAFCGYHGWHDWYLAANLAEEKALDGHLLPGLDPAGVPRALRGTALPFHYNRADELEAIVAEHATDLAAIVMEPIRGHDPAPGFLERVRDLATSSGAVLIFDEITAGFRLNTGGAHLLYGVTPDIAVFAKAMSNGYPMAAVIGTANVMQAAQDSFISSTYWTDRIGPAAALATIRKHRRCDVASHLIRIGTLVQDGWRNAAAKCGLSVDVSGIPPLSHFSFSGDQAQAASTLFTQQMLEHGFLAGGSFYATFAHQDEHVSAYLTAVDEVFAEIHRALEAAILPQLLRGPVAHSGFRRLT